MNIGLASAALAIMAASSFNVGASNGASDKQASLNFDQRDALHGAEAIPLSL